MNRFDPGLVHREKKMMWIFVLVVQTFSVSGTLPPTVHQAEENENITISWDVSTKKTDVSHINIVCFLDSDPPKTLYHMIRGAEDPESQDQQFAGRVRFDRDALREGRVRVQVSRVTVGNSGLYRCDLAADYDADMKRWQLEETGTFVLNVKRTVDVSVSKPEPGPAAGGPNPPHRSQSKDYIFAALFIAALTLTVVAAVVKILYDDLKQKDSDKDGRSDTESSTRRDVTVDVPDDSDPG